MLHFSIENFFSKPYLIRGNQTLLVVEAKRDDLTRGFTQLAAEMIELGDCYIVVPKNWTGG